MESEFRRLRMDELLAAHAIITEVTDWLLKKGIDQWEQPFPLELYRQRQEAGQNFGLFVGGTLAAVVSLIPSYRPHYWAEDCLPKTPYTWIATLATAIRFKGRNLGRVMLAKSETWLASQGVAEVYLDCNTRTDFFPGYYLSAGYELVIQQTVEANGKVYKDGLLKKRLEMATQSGFVAGIRKYQ